MHSTGLQRALIRHIQRPLGGGAPRNSEAGSTARGGRGKGQLRESPHLVGQLAAVAFADDEIGGCARGRGSAGDEVLLYFAQGGHVLPTRQSGDRGRLHVWCMFECVRASI